MTRLLGALILALVVLAGLAADASGVARPPDGTIVLSCSGCPQDTSGPVLIGISVRTGSSKTIVGPCEAPAASTCPAPYGPAFSRNGSKLAVIDRQSAVAVVGRSGNGYRVLTATRGITAGSQRYFSGVSWAPAEDRLVTSALDGKLQTASPRTSIFTVEPLAGAMRRIHVSTPATGNLVDPAWSPDGRLIAVGSSTEHLYLMRSDGTHLRRLGNVNGRFPAWSPDGSRIAAVDIRGAVWSIGSAGGRARIVAIDSDLDWNAGLAWSPDGRWLVYARNTTFTDGGPYENTGHVLILAAADGSGQRRLAVPALPGDVYSELYGLTWSR